MDVRNERPQITTSVNLTLDGGLKSQSPAFASEWDKLFYHNLQRDADILIYGANSFTFDPQRLTRDNLVRAEKGKAAQQHILYTNTRAKILKHPQLLIAGRDCSKDPSEIIKKFGAKKYFINGGSHIYSMWLDLIDDFYITISPTFSSDSSPNFLNERAQTQQFKLLSVISASNQVRMHYQRY